MQLQRQDKMVLSPAEQTYLGIHPGDKSSSWVGYILSKDSSCT